MFFAAVSSHMKSRKKRNFKKKWVVWLAWSCWNNRKFHNERAVFIAGKKGIKAGGFNAADLRASHGFITRVRELGARCKVFLDLLFGKKPHFLGEPVDIG